MATPTENGNPIPGALNEIAGTTDEVLRILANDRFKRSPSLSRFLQFTVNETLAGRADGLKESILGSAVFGRGDAFDPRLDPIVRVQAAKLRTKLREYYEHEGADDLVIIEIPKGSYVPRFTARVPRNTSVLEVVDYNYVTIQNTGSSGAGSGAWRSRLGYHRWTVAALVLAVAVGAGAVALSRRNPPTSNPSNLHLTRLTRHEGSTTFPVLSRDGKMLAYSSDRSGPHSSIWLQRLGETASVRVTSHDSNDLTPDFSPDGRFIVYRGEHDGGGIYLVPSEGGEEKRLASQAWAPRFSPDGNWVSCIGYKPGRNSALLVIPVSNGQPYELSTGNVRVQSAPVWSPGGDHLLFLGASEVAGSLNPDYDWYLVALTGGSPTRIGFREALAAAGLGVPDRDTPPGDWAGQSVVFSRRRGSTSNIWRLRLDVAARISREVQPVTSGAVVETFPRLSASETLVFVSEELNSHIYSLSLDSASGLASGAPERMTDEASPTPYQLLPSLAAGGEILAFVAQNPSESRLIRRPSLSSRNSSATAVPRDVGRYLLSHDGAAFLYQDTTSGTIHRVREGRPGEKWDCGDCGQLHDWSSDNHWIFVENRARSKLFLLDSTTGARIEWLHYLPRTLMRAEFSPDLSRVALSFEGTGGFVVPFDPVHAPNQREWTLAVSDGGLESVEWSDDAKILYFFSRRCGYRCIWAQRLDRSGKRPQGDTLPVSHFHDNHLTPWTNWLSVDGRKAAFVLTEPRASIWMASSDSGPSL